LAETSLTTAPGIVHVHSAYSHDSPDSLTRLRDTALARGIRFIGLTDHAEDLDQARFAAMVAECAALSDERVRLIPGLEFRFAGFRGLHLLALGLSRWIAHPASPDAFIDGVRGVAALTIAAHPVLFDYALPPSVRGGIDAIEVWNAKYNTRYLPDPRAIRLLHGIRRLRPAIVGTAGLDQHDASNDRRARVVVAARDLSDPLSAIRAGRFTNTGLTMSFDSSASVSPLGLMMLEGGRAIIDRVNTAHDRMVLRAKRRARARSATDA
jgi:PHP domain-containing protein